MLLNNKNEKRNSAFTMIELLIVMVIIGILAGFAIPGYVSSRKRAEDREAQAMLVLIRAAEEVYRMERGSYISCTSQGCNADPDDTPPGLGLDLVTGRPWTYTVTVSGGGATFRAVASNGGTGDWCVAENVRTATSGNGC